MWRDGDGGARSTRREAPAARPGGGQSTGRAARTGRITAARVAWRRLPARQHAAAVLGLALLAFLAYGGDLLVGGLDDENIYLRAFERLAAGGDPYEEPFLYLPATAVIGAWIVETFGDFPLRVALRLGNLFGVALLGWIAVAFVPAAPSKRFVVAAAALLLSPGVYTALLWNNVSLLAGVIVVGSLLAWPSAPVLAGLALGLSVLVKPMAPGAIAAVGLHRPADPARIRAKWTTALVAGCAVLAVLPVGWELYEGMMRYGETVEPRVFSRNASLYQVAYRFGFPVHGLPLAVGVVLAGCSVLRRVRLGPVQAYGAAAALMLLALPLVWNHTMLVALPLLVLALVVAADRRRRAAEGDRRRRTVELAVVGTLCAAVYASEAPVFVEDVVADPLLAWIVLVPTLAPSLLTAYVVHHTEPF